jgi:hypothetical protein
MVAAKVSVPQIVGAVLSVGSPEAYFSTIRRVFVELGIPKGQADILASLRSESVVDPMGVLDELFRRRHNLVHEISMGEVGAWVQRDNVDLAEAARFGRMVLALMKLVEEAITSHAPKDFPNRLSVEGYLEDPTEFLDQEIARLENEIANSIKANPDIAGIAVTPNSWEREVEASALAMAASAEFLDVCNFAGQRYIDYRGPLRVSLKINRLNYLTKLAENFL